MSLLVAFMKIITLQTEESEAALTFPSPPYLIMRYCPKHINETAKTLSSYSSQIAFTMKEFEKGNFKRFVTSNAEKITHISLSAQGQADAISEINKGVSEISDVVSRNSSISEQSAAAFEEFSAQSTVMMSQIARFQLEE